MTARLSRIGAFSLVLALFLLASASAQTLPQAKPEEVGLSSERLERLTQTLNGYVETGRLAGGVAMVLRDGKVAYTHAFGQRDRQAASPMRPDTIFRIASQTKALVSTAVLMLQEQGRLVLSDPVSKYVPEFRETTVAVPRDGGGYDIVKPKRGITIRDLLTHTSGIDYGYGTAADRWKAAGIQGWYFADRDEPIAATVSRMAALPFQAQPGERWIYGYSLDILGVVVERASGETLEAFLQSHILTPLRMVDTHFFLPPSKRERLAVVYTRKDTSPLEPAPAPGGMTGQGAYVDGPRKSFSGGAGLLSTAVDYARFLQMLLNGGELDGVRILGRKSVELMTVDHLDDIEYRPGEGFGLGFSVLEDLGARGTPGSTGEFGWGGAYHSTYWVDPRERLAVLYFTQLIPAGDIDDYAKLRALVYQAIVQ
jgi:CubicO group peptidase (beta-lactamase class C family)